MAWRGVDGCVAARVVLCCVGLCSGCDELALCVLSFVVVCCVMLTCFVVRVVLWCGVAWCDMDTCDVACCGVLRRGGMARCDVLWRGVVRCVDVS